LMAEEPQKPTEQVATTPATSQTAIEKPPPPQAEVVAADVVATDKDAVVAPPAAEEAEKPAEDVKPADETAAA
ncbi:hypothetical protein A2U01_0105476, partial [Trifolium medium]|nr:hypothetical protein [Trifolium medium]